MKIGFVIKNQFGNYYSNFNDKYQFVPLDYRFVVIFQTELQAMEIIEKELPNSLFIIERVHYNY